MNTLAWLDRLTSIDTTSRNSNLGLIETARDALKGYGLDPWLNLNAEGTKANLFCTLPAQDGGTQGGIALSGHTDTVPVDGQNWSSDPFTLTERGGKLYARGSCDMKGFIACAVAMVPEFMAMPRAKPLHLALSYDEEVGCVGAPVMLAELAARGIDAASVTLHVGAGTFQPCKTENLAEHQMHSEWYEVPAATLAALERCRQRGGRVVAVGTTTVRTLESWARTGQATGDTNIFITPGFEFQVVDVLITNFHLPKSTLMMLVSAFAGYAHIMGLYRHAMAQQYRFFSYGDAMLLERAKNAIEK